MLNKFRWLTIALLVLLWGNILLGQNPWKINLGVDGMYDNNILNYSQYDIQRFLNNTEAHQSAIHSFDDFIVRADAEIEYISRHWRKHPLRLRLSARNYAYAINGIKDYQLYRFDIKWHTKKRNYLAGDYRYIPRYYLRHYVDRDRAVYLSDPNQAYLPCTFKLQQTHIYYTHYWRHNLFTSVGVAAGWLRYNPDFTEYDTNNLGTRLEVFYFLNSWIKLGLQYEFTSGDNIGQDPSRPSGDSDLSYTQHELTWKVRTDVNNLIGWRDLGLDFNFYERLRKYSSDAPVQEDIFHSGRTNWRHRYEVIATMDVRPYLDLVLNYQYEDRVVNSDYPLVIQLKEYSTTIISVGLEYALRW